MDARRKKILFQSKHRGTKELDLCLGNFAEDSIGTMTESDLTLFESILSEKDLDVYDWIFRNQSPPEHQNHRILEALRLFSKKV